MSKTAEKSATRSASKHNPFNPRSGPVLRKTSPPPKDTWWLVGAGPTEHDREQFIAASHARAMQVWGAKTPDHPARVKA